MFFVERRLGVQTELSTDIPMAVKRVRLVVVVVGGVASCLGAGGVGVARDMLSLLSGRGQLGIFPAQAHFEASVEVDTGDTC